MKRLYRLAVAVALLAAVMTLVACNNSPAELSAYEKYIKASEALDNAGSLSANMDTAMTMKASGVSFDVSMTGIMNQIVRSATDAEMEMKTTTSAVGVSMDMNVYYKDGYYYVDSYGMKYKTPMSLEDAMSQANVGAISFPESAIKTTDSSLTDGMSQVTFVLDGSALSDVMTQAMGSSLDGLTGGVDGEGLSLSFGDVELSVLIDKDTNIKQMRMVFSFGMDMLGEVVDVDVDMMFEILQIGGVVIEYPDDLDTYELMQ